MVNISMCYSNPTIVNMYTYYRKLEYEIMVNGGGYGITYFVASYRVYSPYIVLTCVGASSGSRSTADTISLPLVCRPQHVKNLIHEHRNH